MVRPRWHDVLIGLGITGILALGVWALWWDDVRKLWGPGEGSGSAVEKLPTAKPQT